jgi:short-subunit dehydrogenase
MKEQAAKIFLNISGTTVSQIASKLRPFRKKAAESFQGQSAIITGGSRGLGLALARELVKEGANVTLLARDEKDLKKAEKDLLELQGGAVHTIVCDITHPDRLKSALHEAATHFGKIDLLINNAGSITVGPWETMSQKDFESQMKLHVFAVINATRFALPYLRKEGSGKRIVNICSMGGRVAVPHMLPYDTSKFALSGFSQGVAAELATEGISVTTIYPTLMRTGSPIQAKFKGDQEKEFAWFQTADIFPGVSMSAEAAAKKILKAARERRWELMPSFPAKVRMVAAALFPETMGTLMVQLNRRMPKGDSTVEKTGEESRAAFDESSLTKPFVGRAHAIEEDMNQVPHPVQ